MSEVTVYGAPYSTYVRAVRLALEEKGVPYDLVEVDILSEEGAPAEHYARQPFGKIPAFEHAGFPLYETTAINHYIDEAFDGPALMPSTAEGRARANQIIGLLDSHGYKACVWDVFVERVFVPDQGGESNEETIAAGLKTAETCMTALEGLMGEGAYLAGSEASLADLHAYPIFRYFCMTPDGAEAFKGHPKLCAWWECISARPSVAATVSPLESEEG
jgi:glutathione S-transferase